MYYDTYRGKRRRGRRRERRRGGCGGWLLGALLKLALLALMLIALIAGALYILPVSLMNVEPANMELSLTDGLPSDRVNILLLGLDALNEGMQRSDSIMIASVGNDGVRLVSIMRDTMVNIPGYGRHKLNAAHALGGPELVMRTINETFALNITNYAAIDFRTLVDIVDALGGVDVGIEANELEYLNSYAYRTYRSILKIDPEKYTDYPTPTSPETRTGTLRLNGIYATGYTRIRYSDSDYVRASRQREVFSAILSRFKECWWNPAVYAKLWTVMQENVQTNLSIPEVISLAEKAVLAGEVQTARMPMDQYKQDSPSAIEITDTIGNINSMHAFLYQ